MLSGRVTAFFLFDVADAIDLAAVRLQIDTSAPARLRTKPSTPPHLQYQAPPLAFDGSAIGAPISHGFEVRFKLFDYGVVSVSFTKRLSSEWDDLIDAGIALHDDADLRQEAERLCVIALDIMGDAVSHARATFLSEDYVVFAVTAGVDQTSAEAMLAAHGASIAQLVRGERMTLSVQEREEVLRHQISYYENDVAVISWSSAFLFDTEEGALGTTEILEFANSQLLEFRYYDHLLDAELSRLYRHLQARGWRSWAPRRHTRAARQVQSFFIDLNELTDRTENALKIAGDVYAARVFNLTAARLGLNDWKAAVRDKLKTVDDIYRFAVERAAIVRSEFLELTIVVLIVLELVLLTD